MVDVKKMEASRRYWAWLFRECRSSIWLAGMVLLFGVGAFLVYRTRSGLIILAVNVVSLICVSAAGASIAAWATRRENVERFFADPILPDLPFRGLCLAFHKRFFTVFLIGSGIVSLAVPALYSTSFDRTEVLKENLALLLFFLLPNVCRRRPSLLCLRRRTPAMGGCRQDDWNRYSRRAVHNVPLHVFDQDLQQAGDTVRRYHAGSRCHDLSRPSVVHSSLGSLHAGKRALCAQEIL